MSQETEFSPSSFKQKFEEAVSIRAEIQDVHRVKYNNIKKEFEENTGLAGKELKFLVDMYHYRSGGYPNENSLPKHQEVLNNFANLVKYFNLIGLDHEYQHILDSLGIEIKIKQPVEDFELENLGKDFSEHLLETIKECSEIQGDICNLSDSIKRGISKEISEKTSISSGIITQGVMFEYQKRKDERNQFLQKFAKRKKSQDFINKLISEGKTDEEIIKILRELDSLHVTPINSTLTMDELVIGIIVEYIKDGAKLEGEITDLLLEKGKVVIQTGDMVVKRKPSKIQIKE